MSDKGPAVVWFRQDLRLADNPALDAAAASGRPVVCLYVLDDVTPGRVRIGGAGRWWLHHSLKSLAADTEKVGGSLVLRQGEAAPLILDIVREIGAGAVFWNRCYEPWAIARDKAIKAGLKTAGVEAHSFNGSLCHEPWEIAQGNGEPYKVYTPYSRAWAAKGASVKPSHAPKKLSPWTGRITGEALDDLALLPTKPDWAGGLRDAWQPGEAAARKIAADFLENRVGDYAVERNRPDHPGTSRLSPYLHFGQISARALHHAAYARAESTGGDGFSPYVRQLAWRDFAHHTLFHFPDVAVTSLRSEFETLPWESDPEPLKAWQQGRTGYPIVDAGMRELRATGYMHNRVRMIAGSFLTKDLLVRWQDGADWFWDNLCDADLANNAMGWQWVAGSGIDAAPYFRIFNPVSQGRKFDPEGTYVRRWVRELAQLPTAYVHAPWEAPADVLHASKVVLGRTYPQPMVDHATARQRALDSYKALARD